MPRFMYLDESGGEVYYDSFVPNVRIHFTRKRISLTVAVPHNLPFRLLKRTVGREFGLNPSEIEFYSTKGGRQFLCADRESIGPYIQKNDTFRVEINSRTSRQGQEQSGGIFGWNFGWSSNDQRNHRHESVPHDYGGNHGPTNRKPSDYDYDHRDQYRSHEMQAALAASRREQEDLERALEASRAAAASEPRSQAPSVDAFQGYGRSDKPGGTLMPYQDFDYGGRSDNTFQSPSIDRGNIYCQGSISQYAMDGGRSACTSICLLSCRIFLVQGASSLTPSKLDCVVREGATKHRSLGMEHSSVDELWNLSAFSETVQGLKLCEGHHGVLQRATGFRPALEHALSQMRAHGQVEIAMILTKSGETILCSFQEGTWYMFDSHGQSHQQNKTVYVKQYNSLEDMAAGLLVKHPLQDFGGDAGMMGEMYNMYEAYPIVLTGDASPPAESTAAIESADFSESKFGVASGQGMYSNLSTVQQEFPSREPGDVKFGVASGQGVHSNLSTVQREFPSGEPGDVDRGVARLVDAGNDGMQVFGKGYQERGDTFQSSDLCDKLNNMIPKEKWQDPALGKAVPDGIMSQIGNAGAKPTEDNVTPRPVKRSSRVEQLSNEPEGQFNQRDVNQRKNIPPQTAGKKNGPGKKTPKKLLVRLDRSRDFLSPDDIGLSVALCNKTRRVAESGARAEDGTIRCMVTCCAREIGNISRLWCERCGRLVCSTCLVAHVTNIESTSSMTPRPICLDCTAQIVDDIDPNVDSNLVRTKGFLQEHKIEKNMKVLEQRALEAQEIVLRDEAMEEFRPRMEHLRREIKDLEAHLSELGGTPSNPVSVPKPVDRNVPKKALVATASAKETRKLIAKLEKQLSAHHKRGVPEGEVLLKEYFERQEKLASQLEEAQVRLAVLESEKVQEETTTRDSDYSTINNRITATTALIQRMEGSANRTSKEQQNMRGGEKTQQLVLKELKLIQDKMQKLLPKAQGGTLKNGMESMQGDLRNIVALLGQPNQLRTQYPNEFQEAMAALDIQSPGNAVNNEPDVAECRAHLAAIGKPHSQWPLPLGLDFPTPSMNKRLEDLRSKLSRQHAATWDEFTKEFSADLEQLGGKRILLLEDVNRLEKTKERQKEEERRRVVQRAQKTKFQHGRQTREERREEREMEARQDLSELRQNTTYCDVTGDLRKCNKCKKGPVDITEDSVQSCPNCGFDFSSMLYALPYWDGPQD